MARPHLGNPFPPRRPVQSLTRGGSLHWFLLAAVTNHHKGTGFRNAHFVIYSSGGQKSVTHRPKLKSRHWQGWSFWKFQRRISFLGFWFWGCFWFCFGFFCLCGVFLFCFVFCLFLEATHIPGLVAPSHIFKAILSLGPWLFYLPLLLLKKPVMTLGHLKNLGWSPYFKVSWLQALIPSTTLITLCYIA